MDVEGPAAAVRVAQDAQPQGVPVGGVAAQGVLAGGGAAENQVDVRAGLPRGQRLAVRGLQGQAHHALGHDLFARHAGLGLEFAGGEGEPRAAVLHRLQVCGGGLRLADQTTGSARDDLDRERGEAADHLLGPALGGADDADLGPVQAGDEFLDRDLGHEPGDRRAHAGVDALTEGEDLVVGGEGAEQVERLGPG